jgi:lipid II:glycine glycyltransferase (peptidoglycan interpeptide bridge formation enzyme)
VARRHAEERDRLRDRLRELGWSQKADTGAGFGDVQPRYVFQVPLSGRTESDLLAGFNQLWRRNIKKAEKAGVEVAVGTCDDLPAFHEVYVETAVRDKFTARGLPYFQRMYRAMSAEDPDRLRLYLARHEGRVLAATTMVRVGAHSWYSYGASSNEGRDVRPSNAIQWAMIRDSLAAGCDVYDMRGISDTLDPDDHLFGLIQFKLGTGGYAQEYLGEWDLRLRPMLSRAFDAYLARR